MELIGPSYILVRLSDQLVILGCKSIGFQQGTRVVYRVQFGGMADVPRWRSMPVKSLQLA